MRNLSNEKAIRQYVDERLGVVSIIASGATFAFTLDSKAFEPPSDGLDGYVSWREALRSGLYATIEEAVAAAEEHFPWIGTWAEGDPAG